MNNSFIKNELNQNNKRSVRQIKKVKNDGSFISSLKEPEEVISSKPSQNIVQYEKIKRDDSIEEEEDEIIMEGNLLYRYSQDQIEIEGTWSMSSEKEKNKPYRFSYLLSQNKNKKVIQIPKKKKILIFHIMNQVLMQVNICQMTMSILSLIYVMLIFLKFF